MTTMTDTLADKFDEIVGQEDPTDNCYSQEELDQLLRDKENEVKEQFLQEERDIRKDIAEIRSKFDESVNRDRRQQEEIKKLKAVLESERLHNRKLRDRNEGLEKAKADNDAEMNNHRRMGAKEMHRLMRKESAKVYEFAEFIRGGCRPNCTELDEFIEEEKRFQVRLDNDPSMTATNVTPTQLFQIHRVDWDEETLYTDIFKAIHEHSTASFSQPPPPLPSSTRSSGVGAQGTTGQNSDDVKDPLTRLILRVREIYPEMSEDTVFAALLEMKEANGGRLNSGNQGYEDIINYIAAMSDPPPTMRTQTPAVSPPACLICKLPLKEAEDLFKIPCCGQQFHTVCIQEWLVQKESCPKCKKD